MGKEIWWGGGLKIALLHLGIYLLAASIAYQLAILIAAQTNSVEVTLREHAGYQRALAGFEIVIIAVLVVTIVLGCET